MKKIIFILSAAMVISTMHVFSQTSEKPWNVGIYGGKSEYNGDLGSGFFNYDQPNYLFGAVSLSRYLSPRFNLGIYGSYGDHGMWENNVKNFRASMLYGNLELQFKFVKNEEAFFKPYLFAGIGARNLTNYTVYEGADLIVPVGLGLDFKLTDIISIRYTGSFGYTNHDTRDWETGNGDDLQLQHSLGLTFNFGAMKDTDGDGVSDKKDKCPGTPMGALVDETGCIIDKDKDGLADNQDECPEKAGVAKFNGCPDSDNDGIEDRKDECPDKAGLTAFNGCPDTDKDGIEDRKDECPDKAGLTQFNGCPDTDGDGITDAKDRCPTEAGPVATQGCPDKDNDGIIDKEDKCPDVPGIIENKGCPEIKAETKQLFEKALHGIQFETGKDVIRKKSFQILDDVVKVMNENPAYLLSIYGHTDNTGGDELNMNISDKRANAVKKYLVDKGVPENRITEVKGFGETMPVDTNDTPEGRTKNRRVEFKVVF
jgi:outer membrane protein OmpA-like peptidoglycan-associated protein